MNTSDRATYPRRTFLRRTAGAAALTLVADGLPSAASALAAGAEPQPAPALPGILAALERYPLVALCEHHHLQEWHDVVTALLHHPLLPERITHIVVEFGNARYQELADRFVLDDRPVANAELEQIWRTAIGGITEWDAPVYAQFFRTVRAINWMLPASRRIRVLLGDSPIDWGRFHGPADADYVLAMLAQRDAHYAAVVEREVLGKGGSALLIAGNDHLLRGLHALGQPQAPNAGSVLAQRHPGALYVVDSLLVPPGPPADATAKRLAGILARWPRPALAALAGTWLGATTRRLAGGWINAGADLASSAAAARYERQADAVLYLGPGAALTASRAEPAIYQSGPYRAFLERISPLAQRFGGPADEAAQALRQALAGPSYFAR
jgi:hypothetical protein